MKKKIVYVVHGLNIGGLEKQLLQHVRRLLVLGDYEITILTISQTAKDHNLNTEVPDGVDVVMMNFKHVYSLRSYFILHRMLRTIDPDIVISSQFLANTAVRAVRFFSKFKVIAREHNIHPEWTVVHKVINAILIRVSNDVYLAVSKEAAAAAAAASFVSIDRVRVVENGIDIESWSLVEQVLQSREDLCNKLTLDVNKKYVLSVARLTKKKRIDRLLQAFAVFSKHTEEYDLLIIGDGQESVYLHGLMHEYGIENRVHFLGSQNNTAQFYRIADFFVIASDHEGFPNVALEALFFQLPIVSTPVPGITSVIVNSEIGIVCQSNVESLADAMLEIKDRSDISAQSQGLAAKNHIKNLSIDKVVNKYVELFNTI
jgi:glycosyltransferase involved in cell wall biosynthesis